MYPRTNRLFGADGKCLQIALDHALFNEYPLLDGVEDIDRVIGLAADGGADAILLSPGQSRHLQALRGNRKPALVMRADVANVYQPKKPTFGFSRLIEKPVERALRLDAAAILLNFFFVPDNPKVHEDCIANICAVKPDCERYGLPLMVEPLVLVLDPQTGGYTLSGDVKLLLPLHRQAVELGADILKADPTDSVENYRRMVELAGGIPLLPRGGGKVDEREILVRTGHLLAGGASGVVYGRNVFQHPRPVSMIQALRAMIHDGVDVDSAVALAAQ